MESQQLFKFYDTMWWKAVDVIGEGIGYEKPLLAKRSPELSNCFNHLMELQKLLHIYQTISSGILQLFE